MIVITYIYDTKFNNLKLDKHIGIKINEEVINIKIVN